MSEVEKATSTYMSGFNCAESIISTYAPRFGIDRDTALKLACGFGAGMGKMGNVCGAVTGAFVILGLRYGRTVPEDEGSKEQVYDSVREFTRRFIAKHGSITCNDLLGCDISTEEGREEATDKELFTEICPSFVTKAAEILEEML
jgi:C_GCAxxG_C_C family probable redox protein